MAKIRVKFYKFISQKPYLHYKISNLHVKISFLFYKMALSNKPRMKETPFKEEEEVFETPMPKMEFVTIISNEDHHYIIPKVIACQSKLLAAIFSSDSKFQESLSKTVNLDYPTHLCDIFVQFLFFKLQKRPKTEFQIQTNDLLDLYAMADFLGV